MRAPSADTIPGLRNRAILSVGLQVGLERAKIAVPEADVKAALDRDGKG